jgi:hypothetical protein
MKPWCPSIVDTALMSLLPVHAAADLAASPAGKAIAAVTGRGLVNLGTYCLPLPDYPHAAIGAL